MFPISLNPHLFNNLLQCCLDYFIIEKRKHGEVTGMDSAGNSTYFRTDTNRITYYFHQTIRAHWKSLVSFFSLKEDNLDCDYSGGFFFYIATNDLVNIFSNKRKRNELENKATRHYHYWMRIELCLTVRENVKSKRGLIREQLLLLFRYCCALLIHAGAYLLADAHTTWKRIVSSEPRVALSLI